MKFYRYEIGKTENLFKLSWTVSFRLKEFDLVKETPKGYWITQYGGLGQVSSKKVWVSSTAKKRYAYPTKKEALESAVAKTNRRISFLERDLGIAEAYLHALEIEQDNVTPPIKVVDIDSGERAKIVERILNRKME